MSRPYSQYKTREWFKNMGHKRYISDPAMRSLDSTEVRNMAKSPGMGLDELDGIDSRKLETILRSFPSSKPMSGDRFHAEARGYAKIVSMGAEYLDRGAYGMVFKIPAASLSGRFADIARSVGIDVAVPPTSAPPQTGVVVMKISSLQNKTSPRRIGLELLELRKHSYLSKPVVAGVRQGMPSSSNYVPKYFGGGYNSRIGAIVSFMEFVEGVQIGNLAYLEKNEFEMLELAFVSLWARRIFHADAHDHNLMMTRSGPKIIDFGQSIVLPERLRATSVQQALSPPYFKELDDYGAMWSFVERYTFQNPNTLSLRYIYQRKVKKDAPPLRTFEAKPLPPRYKLAPFAFVTRARPMAKSAMSSDSVESGEILPGRSGAASNAASRTAAPPPSARRVAQRSKVTGGTTISAKPRVASKVDKKVTPSAKKIEEKRAPPADKKKVVVKVARTWNEPTPVLKAAPAYRLKAIARGMKERGYPMVRYSKAKKNELVRKISEARKVAPDFSSRKTVPQLKKIAKDAGVAGIYKMKRENLVRAIKQKR